MAKKIKLKTSKNTLSVADFINGISDPQLKKDSKKLLQIFKEVTKAKPKMWGSSIVGFGEYVYHRSNGDEGLFMATGFSPRKSGPTVYIMPGYQEYSHLMEKIGPHKLGKSCLYLKNLEDVHVPTLKKLITLGIRDLKKTHEVRI